MIVILPILPKLALFEILKSKISTAPLKLAVLPDNSSFTVRLATVTLPLKLAVLPPISVLTVKFSTVTLPVKLAVLPDNSSFTVRLATVTLPLKLAVLPANSRLIVILLLVIFDVTLKLPVRFASLLEITSTLATPLLLIITSPFAVGILTLLVPLLIDAPPPTVDQ